MKIKLFISSVVISSLMTGCFYFPIEIPMYKIDLSNFRYISDSKLEKSLKENEFFSKIKDEDYRFEVGMCYANKKVHNRITSDCDDIFKLSQEKCFNNNSTIDCAIAKDLAAHIYYNKAIALRIINKLKKDKSVINSCYSQTILQSAEKGLTLSRPYSINKILNLVKKEKLLKYLNNAKFYNLKKTITKNTTEYEFKPKMKIGSEYPIVVIKTVDNKILNININLNMLYETNCINNIISDVFKNYKVTENVKVNKKSSISLKKVFIGKKYIIDSGLVPIDVSDIVLSVLKDMSFQDKEKKLNLAQMTYPSYLYSINIKNNNIIVK